MSERIEINEIEARTSEQSVCSHMTNNTDHDEQYSDDYNDDYDSDEDVDDLAQLYDYIDETHQNSTHGAYSDYTKQFCNTYSQEIYDFMNWVFYTNDLNLLERSIRSDSSQSFYNTLRYFYNLPENESHDKQLETKMLDNPPRGLSSPLISSNLFEEIKHLNLLYRRYGTTKESDERNRICGLFANAHTIDELKCGIQLLSDHTTDEYKTVHRYVTNAGENYFVKHIFRIERQTEEQSFKQFENCRRMLLFHGTPIFNCHSILLNGLKSGVNNGIYFADMPQKSYAYCQKFNSYFDGKCYDYVILFVADVAVGNLDGTGLPQDFSCVQYTGHHSRDVSDVTTIDNAIVPYGKAIFRENIVPVDNIPANSDLGIFIRRSIFRTNILYQYNEYLVARPQQVKLKYLVVFRKSLESQT